MIAIQRNNPEAFSRNNINILRRGAILRMPDVDDVNSISASTANSEVREQAQAIKSRQSMASSETPLLLDDNAAPPPARQEVAQQPEETTPEPEAEVTEPAAETPESEQDVAEAADEADSQALEPAPQLELVPPSQESALDELDSQEDASGNNLVPGSVQTLREELARSEEELINQQQQNAYLEQRLSELENQLSESQSGTVDDENLATMEERLREERQAQAAQAAKAEDKPWYSGMTMWLLGLLLLIAVIVGWLMSRRGGADDGAADASDTLRDLKGEAEDVLRVLDSKETAVEPDAEGDTVTLESEPSDATVVVPGAVSVERSRKDTEDEAELLDEESADPEIQLDLARAYISMGDKEAARVILEEVIAHGSDEQKTEAGKMKDML